MHLLSSQAERVHQEWNPLPDPRRPIGDKKYLVRLGDLESLQVGTQHGHHRIWHPERRVNYGSKTGFALPLSIYHIDDQHLRLTPCPCIALAPFFGLGAPFGLAQPQASPITANHDTTPRHSVLKHGRVELLLEPRSGRI